MSNQSDQEFPGQGDQLGAPVAADSVPRVRGRRGRVLLPAAIAAVVAAGVVVVPALAASQDDLPSVTAQQLLTKVLSSKVQTFSGSVTASVDLGLPAGVSGLLPSAAASAGADKAVQSQTAAAQQQLLALLAGGKRTFQVAVDGPDRQRVSSTDSGTAFTLVHNGSTAWAYEAQGNTATELTGISGGAGGTDSRLSNPQQVAAQALKALGPSTTVSVAGTSKVAGQSVYELSVKPKGSGSTVGEVRIAVDAANGMPLQVRVNPSDGSSSILNVSFAKVSFVTPAASTFAYTPPSGAKVIKQAAPAHSAPGAALPKDFGTKDAKGAKGSKSDIGSNERTIGTGWSTIYSFAPSATDSKGGSTASGISGLKALGKQVTGGTLISTKLVNVLITDNGTVYAGAVTPALLQQAAGK
ncbi:outer membrane lipoprotein carrier protein LolA [Streptacidiphilus sp. N1-12]|uniref:Outer membrane lipoprotein carrier protein LolA n=2 Tax=Streptacidiphilus alkalitolerans TaxID=3342712 RepID=A0ABV6V6A9_9ACTN